MLEPQLRDLLAKREWLENQLTRDRLMGRG